MFQLLQFLVHFTIKIKMHSFAFMCTLTTHVSIKVHVWVILYSRLHGTGQFLLLHLAVEGAMCTIGDGGNAGLHTAAGALGVRPPPRVPHH